MTEAWRKAWSWLPRQGLAGLIEIYRRYVSPCLGRHCRFHPTCSGYAIEALRRHGFVRGATLTARRLLRCHPFHPGGYDPVPMSMDRVRGGGACRRPDRKLEADRRDGASSSAVVAGSNAAPSVQIPDTHAVD